MRITAMLKRCKILQVISLVLAQDCNKRAILPQYWLFCCASFSIIATIPHDDVSLNAPEIAERQRRITGTGVLLAYSFFYTCFAIGAAHSPVIVNGAALTAGTKAWLGFSAIIGAIVATCFIFFFSSIHGDWQRSWKRYGMLFIGGSIIDIAANYAAHPSRLGVLDHTLIITLIGLANLGMLFAAVGIGLIVAQGMREVNYLLMAAVVAALTDIVSVFMGPTKHLITTDVFDYLSFQWGILGLGNISPIIGMGDFVFLTLFFTGARKFGWDARKTLGAMCCALAVGLLATLYGPRALPALPFMAMALLVVHAGDIKRTRATEYRMPGA